MISIIGMINLKSIIKLNTLLFFIIIIMAFGVLITAVKAQVASIIEYRCSGLSSSDLETKEWKPLIKGAPCTTNAWSNNTAYIFVQFKRGTTATDKYPVIISRLPGGADTGATLAPTAAVSPVGVGVTPPGTAARTFYSKQSELINIPKKCANGLELSAEEAVSDVSKDDCKINAFDTAEVNKHMKP